MTDIPQINLSYIARLFNDEAGGKKNLTQKKKTTNLRKQKKKKWPTYMRRSFSSRFKLNGGAKIPFQNHQKYYPTRNQMNWKKGFFF